MPTRRTLLQGSLATAAAVLMPRAARSESRPHLTTVTTDGEVGLFVRDTGGAGPAVVMTHAWPLSSDVWEFQAAALSKAGCRVITYDRRGFGRSAQPESGYDFDTFANDLAAVIERTGVRDATLIGYSMGGGEVVRYFSRHQGRNVARAVLVAATAGYLLKAENNPEGIPGEAFDGIKQGVRGDRKTYLTGLLRGLFLDAGQSATNPVTDDMVNATLDMAMHAGTAATAACVDAFSRTDFRSELASITVPTLLLHGTSDKAVPFAMAKASAAAIPHSRLIEYQGGSHGIVLTERERVTRDLQAFIAG